MTPHNTISKEHMHRCEVRYVLAQRACSQGDAWEYLRRVRQRRSEAAAATLEADCRNQWAKGNRGAYGDWR